MKVCKKEDVREAYLITEDMVNQKEPLPTIFKDYMKISFSSDHHGPIIYITSFKHDITVARAGDYVLIDKNGNVGIASGVLKRLQLEYFKAEPIE